jgi:transposase
MHFVDWQVRQETEYIPAKLVLVNHKQPIYACRGCQESGEPAPIKTVKTMPEPAFPKSLASPSLVSHIITQKFVMGAPVYRQEQNMEGLGVFFSRQTMCNWIIRAASWMQPIYERLHHILLTQDVAHADETSVQVLREPGRDATTDSTMWVYRSGRDGPPIVLFNYQTTRGGKHAHHFLDGFGGLDPQTNAITRKKYLHVDGYDGYNCVARIVLVDGRKQPDVILVGCWAHVRRKFFEAAAIVKQQDRKSGKRIAADEGLKLCDELFSLEKEFKNMTPEERHAARADRSAAKIAEIKAWLDKAVLEVLPKTATGMAIAYCLSQWAKLTAFLLDGRLEIDNNRAERSVKPFVIGRKNWLFANTPTGATSSATLYSVIETAKENGLIPFEYVKYLLERLPNIDPTNTDALNALLPWSEDIPAYCRAA